MHYAKGLRFLVIEVPSRRGSYYIIFFIPAGFDYFSKKMNFQGHVRGSNTKGNYIY